jgi:hypothetical protein
MRTAAISARKLMQAVFLLAPAAAAAGAQTSFGPVNVGAQAAATVTINIPGAATVDSIVVASQGATALDFSNAGTGTCAAGASYSAGETCTVAVTFTPAYTGTRIGAVQLEDGAGNVIASASLAGIGTGPQIAFDPGAASAIDPMVNGSALEQPYGVAVDGNGNVYIADGGHRRVVEIPAGGGAPIALDPMVNGKGLSDPAGLVVDGAGDLFIADLANDNVVEVPANGGAPVALDPVVNGTGLKYPCGMVFDGAGDLFIADVDNSRVVELPANGSAPVVIDPAINGVKLNYPVALAFDSTGDFYISDLFANRVVEIPAGGGTPVALTPTVNGEPLNHPYGMAVDGAGDLFIADAYARVVEVPASGGAATALVPMASGKNMLNDPIGIALDGAGDLFIADAGNNQVVQVERSAPPALNFAEAAVGSTSSDSPQTVEVENVGNAALAFPLPASGNNPAIAANFTLASGSSSDCPLVDAGAAQAGTLAAGTSCALAISFQPGAEGSVYGGLTLADDSLNAAGPAYATQTIALSGDAPVASLSAALLSFGAQQVGTASNQQTLTLTNTGSAEMTISNVGVTGAGAPAFTLTNGCGATLAVGANCAVEAQFESQAAGPLAAAISISDNAPGSPQAVKLTGAGANLPAVTVTPALTTITTAQALTVTVAVSGTAGGAVPTGTAALASGSYASAPVTLANGSTTITVPAGALAVGSDTLTATYAPDNASATLYLSATGANSVTVTAATTSAAPSAATNVASGVSSSAATLAGTANPNGAATTAYFNYGTSPSLAGASQTAMQSLGSGNTPVAVTANIATGLMANTTYYYQMVGTNSVGTGMGAIDSFTTTPAPYFSISNGTAISVAPGATSANTSTVTIEPWYGFSGMLSLSCSVAFLSQGTATDPPACSVPASVTLANAAAPVTVTVSTTAAASRNERLKRFGLTTGGAALACLLLVCIPVRRRRWLALPALLALLCASAGMGCGGGQSGGTGPPPNPGTTAGNYTITISAVSGSTTETGSVALTVQ